MIGYTGGDWIPLFELVLAEPNPDYMRPGLSYSAMFPHDFLYYIGVSIIQPVLWPQILTAGTGKPIEQLDSPNDVNWADYE